MKNKTKLNLSIIIFQLSFIIALFFIIPGLALQKRSGPQNQSTADANPLEQKYQIIFLSPGGNLSSLSIHLANVQRGQEKILLEVYLNNQLQSSLEAGGYAVSSSTWLPFKFKPIPSQPNDIFTLNITPLKEPPNQLKIHLGQDARPAYSTVFTTDIKTSFLTNLKNQKATFQNRNPLFNFFYLTLIVFLNILLFLV